MSKSVFDFSPFFAKKIESSFIHRKAGKPLDWTGTFSHTLCVIILLSLVNAPCMKMSNYPAFFHNPGLAWYGICLDFLNSKITTR